MGRQGSSCAFAVGSGYPDYRRRTQFKKNVYLRCYKFVLSAGNFKKLVAKCKRLDEASLRAPEVASLCAQGESLLLDLREGPAGVEELEDFARRWPDTPAGGMAWEKAANITYLTAKRSPDREGALAYVIEHYTGTEAATFALQLVYQDAIDEGSSAALCRFRERFPSAPQLQEALVLELELAYEEAEDENTENAWVALLEAYPEHPRHTEANVQKLKASVQLLSGAHADVVAALTSGPEGVFEIPPLTRVLVIKAPLELLGASPSLVLFEAETTSPLSDAMSSALSKAGYSSDQVLAATTFSWERAPEQLRLTLPHGLCNPSEHGTIAVRFAIEEDVTLTIPVQAAGQCVSETPLSLVEEAWTETPWVLRGRCEELRIRPFEVFAPCGKWEFAWPVDGSGPFVRPSRAEEGITLDPDTPPLFLLETKTVDRAPSARPLTQEERQAFFTPNSNEEDIGTLIRLPPLAESIPLERGRPGDLPVGVAAAVGYFFRNHCSDDSGRPSIRLVSLFQNALASDQSSTFLILHILGEQGSFGCLSHLAVQVVADSSGDFQIYPFLLNFRTLPRDGVQRFRLDGADYLVVGGLSLRQGTACEVRKVMRWDGHRYVME